MVGMSAKDVLNESRRLIYQQYCLKDPKHDPTGARKMLGGGSRASFWLT